MMTSTKVLEERHEQSTAKVNDLSNEHVRGTDLLHDVKTKTNDKGNSLTDTTPLVQLKQALTKLRAEIKDFDLRIGVMVRTSSRRVFKLHHVVHLLPHESLPIIFLRVIHYYKHR